MIKKMNKLIKLKDFLLAFDKDYTNVEIYEDFEKNKENNNGMFVAILENADIEEILKNRSFNPYYVVNGKTQIWDNNSKSATLIIHIATKDKILNKKSKTS